MRNKKSLILLAIIVFASFLRLWRLSQVPVSLFGDELDVGYQAFSVLKTGRDYSGNFLPLNFHSLAEWRTPLYLYSSIPTVFLFGITPLGVRLPAAVFGILGVWAMYFLVKELTIYVNEEKSQQMLPFLASFLLAISPWHIQYSRAAFEVTEMLFFMIFGVGVLFWSLRNKGRFLWLSGFCLVLTPWIYSTAKLFTPFFLFLLILLFWKKIISFPKNRLVTAIVVMLIAGVPLVYSTIFGGGVTRFNYISVFSDPTIEPEIGVSRSLDASSRGERSIGIVPNYIDRLFHNKFTFVGGEIVNNFFSPFSTEFLFITGDPNPRHSIEGMGVLFKVESVLLVLGLSSFLIIKNRRMKILVGLWVLLSIIPSALTRDGGNHATRLFIMLPPLIILISYGIFALFSRLRNPFKLGALLVLSVGYIVCFVSYEHLYWVHNPYQSERWWHYGWQQAIYSVKELAPEYKNVIITSADEPPWIFFAAWYEYDPALWHNGYPFETHNLDGFGKVSFIDKFSFGSPQKISLYDWGKIINKDTLYLASAKEVPPNLIAEPQRTPDNLKLLKAVAYPSGEPAFYLFSGKPAVSAE